MLNNYFFFYFLLTFYEVKQTTANCWYVGFIAKEKKQGIQKVCFQIRRSFYLVKQHYTKFLLKRFFLDFQ